MMTMDNGRRSTGCSPLIGLTGRRKMGEQIEDLPSTLDHIEADLFMADYAQAVSEAGGLPIYVPFVVDPVEIIARLDGLLLTGGADIEPARYGREAEADLFPPEPARDELELALLEAALERGIPVLGICRGLQLMNVHGGGTLHQDVPPHACFDLAPDTEVHKVHLEPDSLLGGLYGPTLTVNSLHHQTIEEVADDYVVTGRADDGAVEGLEHRDARVVSVQWHPEMMVSRSTDPIFTWLVDQAS
jgi:putative glutamine amidotransferase